MALDGPKQEASEHKAPVERRSWTPGDGTRTPTTPSVQEHAVKPNPKSSATRVGFGRNCKLVSRLDFIIITFEVIYIYVKSAVLGSPYYLIISLNYNLIQESCALFQTPTDRPLQKLLILNCLNYMRMNYRTVSKILRKLFQ